MIVLRFSNISVTIPTKPRRPFKNFEEFIDYRKKVSKKGIEFPCIVCGGNGRHNCREEHYDIIEGYKLAPFVECRTCEGTGLTTRSILHKVYKLEIKAWRSRIQENND
jgi:hypothetical protein